MKPKDNHKTLPNPLDTEVEESPSSRPFIKMPGAGVPKGVRRKKLKSESRIGMRSRKAKNRIIVIRFILLIGLVVAILGAFLTSWLYPRMKTPDFFYAGSKEVALKNEAKTKEITRFPSPTSAQALALVKQGLTLRDPNQVAEYFRKDSNNPQEIIDYLKEMDVRDGQLNGMNWLSSMGTTAIPLEGVLVNFKGPEAPSSRMALLTPDESGKWRIDFDAFARKVTPSWIDLLKNQAPLGMVRVFIQKDFYYNGPFRDEKQWLCYSIGSIDSKETLRAYCKIGSPQAGALNWMLSKGAKITRATLEIRRVDGADSLQFEISRVLAEDWVLGPTPFEDGFK